MRALRPKQGAKGTTQIWLHEDDLPWLLLYLATEAEEGGLRPIEAIDGPAVAGESEASVETPKKKASFKQKKGKPKPKKAMRRRSVGSKRRKK